ncbi:MAG: threonine/serine exporter family protein [Actinomycetota bacterium]|nr:threonine/serine exporter family protein [Actinomycetota bacterium]
MRTKQPPVQPAPSGAVNSWTTSAVSLPAAEPVVYGPAVIDDGTVNLVLDLALRIGELELAGGVGAADVTATILAVTNAYGLPHCEVDVIFTSITVGCRRGTEALPVTTTRVVRFRALDYTRLAGVDDLVTRIVRGQVTATEAYTELDAIVSGDRTYPRWLATIAWASMAASLAILIGGDFRLALIAGGVTALVDRLGRVLNRRALPFFFQQIVGAATVTAASVGLDASGLLPSQLSPAFVLAAGLTVLLSGLSLVGTVQDAITGFYVTAAGRAFEVTLMTGGLVAGVVLLLQAGDGLGVNLTPPDYPLPQLRELPVTVIAAASTGGFFALASYAPPRALLGAAFAGAAGWTTYAVLNVAGLGATAASGFAAVLVGFAGRVVSRRLRMPPLVMAVAGITPLLPGLTTYRGLFELTVQDQIGGISRLLTAISIAVALGAGVVLGEFLAQPVRSGLGRLERRLAGPRMMGPLGADMDDTLPGNPAPDPGEPPGHPLPRS